MYTLRDHTRLSFLIIGQRIVIIPILYSENLLTILWYQLFRQKQEWKREREGGGKKRGRGRKIIRANLVITSALTVFSFFHPKFLFVLVWGEFFVFLLVVLFCLLLLLVFTLWPFETRSLYIALVVLQFILLTRMALNSQRYTCFCLPSCWD
jgi:hypothetical protein